MTTAATAGAKPIVLAYSGGLDTSFLVPWIAEQYQRPVITVTVDTGGIDAAAAQGLRARALALGAIEHHQIDARGDYFEQVLRFLIMGNVRRGHRLRPLAGGGRHHFRRRHDLHRHRRRASTASAGAALARYFRTLTP